jgi:hypothetical protein
MVIISCLPFKPQSLTLAVPLPQLFGFLFASHSTKLATDHRGRRPKKYGLGASPLSTSRRHVRSLMSYLAAHPPASKNNDGFPFVVVSIELAFTIK